MRGGGIVIPALIVDCLEKFSTFTHNFNILANFQRVNNPSVSLTADSSLYTREPLNYALP